MHDLHKIFKQHGSCYVALKYSRNKSGVQLPGAFVQYEVSHLSYAFLLGRLQHETNDLQRPEHAQAALSAQKQQLHSRSLRVEMASGHSKYS